MRRNALWTAIWIGLVFGLLAFGVLGTFDITTGNQPSDEQLTANYLTHEAAFNDLARQLAREYPGHTAKRGGVIDLATVIELDTNTTRVGIYGRLLQRISVADLRYFTDSGKLILVPDGEQNPDRPSRSYVHLPQARPQAFIEHHAYYWRGPGVDIVTGDLPLTAGWFIRHDTTVEVAVTPY
jgi:hypothetical protein